MKKVEIIKATNTLSNRASGKHLEKLRVGAYCRVSTYDPDQLDSYNSQKIYYTDYIREKDEWELVDIFADEETPYGGIPKSP
jgi:hypothetical protein